MKLTQTNFMLCFILGRKQSQNFAIDFITKIIGQCSLIVFLQVRLSFTKRQKYLESTILNRLPDVTNNVSMSIM